MTDTKPTPEAIKAATPAAEAAAIAPEGAAAAIDSIGRLEAESLAAGGLSVLDRELEELTAKEPTLQSATDSFLDALLAAINGIREEDLVQVTLTQHGTVTIYTRDRAQRRRDIRRFKRDEVDAQ